MSRSPALQAFLDAFADKAGIEPDFIAASDHAYNCRCQKCLDWWASMGPDGDDPDAPYAYGPFSKEEIDAYLKDQSVKR